MTLSDQIDAMGRKMDRIGMLNQKRWVGVVAVLQAAALSFDDDGSLAEVERVSLEWVDPTSWPYVQTQIGLGLESDELDEAQRQAWRQAFSAVYRIAGIPDASAIQ